MKHELTKLLQSYLGMTPKDKNCVNWSVMQEKCAEEINSIILHHEHVLIKALKEIQEYQLDHCELARTTPIYKIADKALEKFI